MDPALQAILEQLNKLGAGQDKLAAYQELKNDTSANQYKLAACQEKLKKKTH
jgi:hypothetical protein